MPFASTCTLDTLHYGKSDTRTRPHTSRSYRRFFPRWVSGVCHAWLGRIGSRSGLVWRDSIEIPPRLEASARGMGWDGMGCTVALRFAFAFHQANDLILEEGNSTGKQTNKQTNGSTSTKTKPSLFPASRVCASASLFTPRSSQLVIRVSPVHSSASCRTCMPTASMSRLSG